MIGYGWATNNLVLAKTFSVVGAYSAVRSIITLIRKNQFDFGEKIYQKTILGIYGFRLLRVKFAEIKAVQLIKIDKVHKSENDVNEKYQMHLVKIDGSRNFVGEMDNRFIFLDAAMTIHNHSGIPLWMNKWY